MAPARRRIVVKLLVLLAATAVLFELAARALLFAPWLAGTGVAAKLRQPAVVAHEEEDLYWWLRTHWEVGVGPETATDHHPELGWLPWSSPTEHRGREPLDGRRRVLLYGDSFSACWTPPGECFEDLMAASDLGATYALLNYGVPAYGLDQILLLLERSVDHYAAEQPVVIVGMLVDRDLDRAGLSYRGGRSKPRFDVERGELVLRPPLAAGAFPPRPSALFGLRLLAHALGGPRALHELACGQGAARRENEERCRLVLERLVRALDERGLESFFLLFHSRDQLEQRTWEDALVTATLDDLGARWISTRAALNGHAAATGRPLDDYFDATGHLNARGNAAAFRAIRDGLAGHRGDGSGAPFDPAELRGPLTPSAYASSSVGGRLGLVRHEYGSREQFPDPAERSRLVFRVGRKGPTEITYDLDGRADGFTATVRFLPLAREVEARVGLTLLADGEPLLELALARGEQPPPIAVDLRGKRAFTIRVDDGGDGIQGDQIALTAPTFTRD